ncbi:MAG: hypothetical protein ACR2ND_00700 [Solirubrobacteraceae bacterium]
MSERGWVQRELAEEFPELALHTHTLDARPGASPPELRERLRVLSSRFRGMHAIALRRNPIPRAYRVFFRQIGLDPDTHRTPIEQAAVKRLLDGEFASQNLLDDGLLIALVETGVPVWALDAAKVEGPLGVRVGVAEHREGSPGRLPAGRILVADAERPLASLFGELAPGRGVQDHTSRMTLFAVQVAGVPQIHVDEALWQVISALGAA